MCSNAGVNEVGTWPLKSLANAAPEGSRVSMSKSASGCTSAGLSASRLQSPGMCSAGTSRCATRNHAEGTRCAQSPTTFWIAEPIL